MGASIAAGDSGTSEPRSAFLPIQLVLRNPVMAPVWIVGLIRLFRSPALAWCGGLAWTWPLLALVFLVSGGKSYYLSGIYPLLVGAGAQPVVEWAMAARARTPMLFAGVALGMPAIGAALPILPVSRFADSPVAEANYDLGEQVGSPTFVDQVAAVVDEQDGSVALLTSNYGEAGALDRYGGAYGLPEAHDSLRRGGAGCSDRQWHRSRQRRAGCAGLGLQRPTSTVATALGRFPPPLNPASFSTGLLHSMTQEPVVSANRPPSP